MSGFFSLFFPFFEIRYNIFVSFYVDMKIIVYL